MNWNETYLDDLLTTPSAALIEDMKKIKGTIMILGAGGKMGPTLALLASKAAHAAGNPLQVIAVSRFSDPYAVQLLEAGGVQTIRMDLLEKGALERLPDAENIIYMAGRKFGTGGNESATWAMNAVLPGLVVRRFAGANIVAFSTGNVYPMMPAGSGGCTEETAPNPVGEYAMSCLARERIFEYGAKEYGCRVLLYRLNYAVDLRYGVLYDLAKKILQGEAVDLAMPAFNCVWQGYANEAALRALLHVGCPAEHLNVTGPETVSVRYAAEELGCLLGREVRFAGVEGDRALLSNAARCTEWFGYPAVGIRELIRYQAEWLLSGGRTLNKPTHFEEQNGKF